MHVKLIIIDEVSMLSSLTLAYIHLRLEELFGGDQWFGSMTFCSLVISYYISLLLMVPLCSKTFLIKSLPQG